MAKTIEELETLVNDLAGQVAEKTKEIKGLQELKGGWSNEIKEVREAAKALEAIKGELKTLTEDRDAVKKELDALKLKESEAGKANLPPVSKESDKEQADKLESKLTDEQKDEIGKFVKSLSEEDQSKFVNDDTFRVAVMKQATTGNGSANPDSIWRVTKSKASGDDTETSVKKLFNKWKSGELVTDERGGKHGKANQGQPTHRKFF